MKKVNFKDIKNLKQNMEKINVYIESSRLFFNDLENLLNVNCFSDTEKLEKINKLYTDFKIKVIK